MKVAACTFSPVWGNKTASLDKMSVFIREAAEKNCDFILFPETSLSGYLNDYEHEYSQKMHVVTAEPVPGESTLLLAELAKEYNMYIAFGLAEKEADSIYNSVVVIDNNGKILGSYRKNHLALDENEWAKRGKGTFFIDTEWGKIGFAICYDAFSYPEIFRSYKRHGVNIVMCSTACGGDGFADFFNINLACNAMTNEMVLVVSNYAGEENKTTYYGSSHIIIPSKDGGLPQIISGNEFGSIIGKTEGIVIADIDTDSSYNNYSKRIYKDENIDVLKKCYETAKNSCFHISGDLNYEISHTMNIKVCSLSKEEIDGKTVADNCMQICNLIRSDDNSEIMVFPESSFGTTEKHCFSDDCEEIGIISQTCRNCKKDVLFGATILADDKKYNCAVWCDKYGKISIYKKLFPGNELFSPGDDLCVVNTEWGPIGIGLGSECFDHPEIISAMKANGVRILLIPAAFSDIYPEERYVLQIKSHSMNQSLFIAVATLEGVGLTGKSMIYGPGEATNPNNVCVSHSGAIPNDIKVTPCLYSKSYDEGFASCMINLKFADLGEIMYHNNPKTGIPNWSLETAELLLV